MAMGVLCVWFNGRSRQQRSEQCRLNSKLAFQLASSETGPLPRAPKSSYDLFPWIMAPKREAYTLTCQSVVFQMANQTARHCQQPNSR